MGILGEWGFFISLLLLLLLSSGKISIWKNYKREKGLGGVMIEGMSGWEAAMF